MFTREHSHLCTANQRVEEGRCAEGKHRRTAGKSAKVEARHRFYAGKTDEVRAFERTSKVLSLSMRSLRRHRVVGLQIDVTSTFRALPWYGAVPSLIDE